jgi:hypothetical protein
MYTRVLVVADGQLGRTIVVPESMNAVSSASNIASCLETTSVAYTPAFAFVSSAYKPAFAFIVLDEPTGDVIIDLFPDDMMRLVLELHLLALEPV